MLKQRPEQLFQEAVSILNSKKLADLWAVSSLLSGLEYFEHHGSQKNFLFPIIHLEWVAMFNQAVLASNALSYKSNLLTSKDIASVVNLLKHATEFEDFPEGSEPPEVRLLKLVATIGNYQLRFQEKVLMGRLARVFAMFEIIPSLHANELRPLLGSAYVDLPSVVPSLIGISAKDFLLIGFALVTFYKARHDEHFSVSDSLIDGIEKADSFEAAMIKRANTLKWMIDNAKNRNAALFFKATDPTIPGSGSFEPEKVSTYLRLLARSTRVLRDINRKPHYLVGQRAVRLSPLERFPVVDMEDGFYIVPNYRFLDMSLTDVLHYIMQEHFPQNEFNQTMGRIQEIYLNKFVNRTLPNIYVIQERRYRRSGGDVDGPDLTLICKENRLITVESKAKHVPATTRANPATALLAELKTAVDALLKLPQKIQELYAGLREYEDVQEILNSTKGNVPIAVVIVAEGVRFMQELVFTEVQADSTHPLRNYPFPFCVMALDVFEKAVQLSSQYEIPLSQILQEYFEDGKNIDPATNSAEGFRGRLMNPPTIIEEYMATLFKEILAHDSNSKK